MTYGYCRISTKEQNIERQVRNIREKYPEASVVKETFTGTTSDRPAWIKLKKHLKPGDIVVFDSVSRMSRNAEEGFSEYMELFQKGIELRFLKEPHIDTETYKAAMTDQQIKATGTDVDEILEGVNRYLLRLAKKQILIAFEQSQKEVDDLRQRTKEGILTARLAGKQIGRPRGHYVTERERKAKNQMLRRAATFEGDLSDADAMKIIGISRGTYYKYKKELLLEKKNRFEEQ